MKINIRCKRFAAGILALAGFGLFATAWAQDMMPDREVLSGTQIVVWGNNLPGGATTYEIDFGDTSTSGAIVIGGNGQSYMPATHTYNTALAQEDFIAELILDGAPTGATVTITVINDVVAVLTADQILDIKINQAIQDGLRNLYVNQVSREANFGGPFASWYSTGGDSYTMAHTSLAVLAFENHGYNIASGDIYSPVVQAGLNFIFNNLRTLTLSDDGPGDPCAEIHSGIGYGDVLAAPLCTGLSDLGVRHGYSTAVETLAIAGSGAPGTTVTHGAASGGFTVGKTYLEIAQRLVNTIAFGERFGGWRYTFNTQNDGSANGWNVLALLDAQAFGATIPAWLPTQIDAGTAALTLADGSMGYTSRSNQNTAKSGIRLQAMSLTGVPLNTAGPGGPTPQQTVDYINAGWKGRSEGFACGPFSPNPLPPFQTNTARNNFGCLYAMYNVFKGLKLYAVTMLPASSRLVDQDWHKEYQDYLVQTQSSPTLVLGGNWGNLSFSCCWNNNEGETALALLILSDTALILPDPVKFATVGLKPFTAENLVDEDHTVTAHAEGACTPEPCTGAPVPGATVDFEVLTGPNAGATGSAVTNADGDATFTYTGSGGTGTDTIQACIGTNICSNIVDKIWRPRVEVSVDKDYRYTSVCFEKDNDRDGLFNEDPVDFYPDGTPIDNDRDGLFNEDDVDCPDGTDLGGLLPYVNGNFILDAVINKKGKVTSYNPGQYYAVSTITPLEGVELLETLWISEEYGDCTEGDFPLSALNPKMGTGGGNVVIVAVGPDGVAWQIFDSTFPNVTVSDSIGPNGIPDDAEAYLVNVSEDTTILMYVKFGPGLKGLTFAGSDSCENVTTAWTEIDGEEVSDNAVLMVIEK